MKSKKISISPSEWEIMEAIWQQSPLSAAEIYNIFAEQNTWNVKTVRSFLDRLEKKQAIGKIKIHGMNVYRPLLEREKCLRKESHSFVERFFQGNPVTMISHFINNETLSDDDKEQLRILLDNIPTENPPDLGHK